MPEKKRLQDHPPRKEPPSVARQNLLTAFLGLGLLYGMGSTLLDADLMSRSGDRKPGGRKTFRHGRMVGKNFVPFNMDDRLRAEFEARYAALGMPFPLFIFDSDAATHDVAGISSRLSAFWGGKVPEETFREVATHISGMAGLRQGGFAGGCSVEDAEGRRISFHVVLDKPDFQSPESWLAEAMEATGRKLKSGALPSMEELARIILWHECFGHCTEEASEFLAAFPKDAPGMAMLRELRADAVAMTGMVRDCGDDGIAWRLCDMRALAVFHGGMDEDYATFPQRAEVARRLSGILEDPLRCATFMNMEDADIPGFVDRMLSEIVPSVPDLENGIWTLDDARRLRKGEVAGDGVSPLAREVLARVRDAENRILAPMVPGEGALLPEPIPAMR